MISDLPPIPKRGRLTSSEILLGAAMPAITKLQVISEDNFEVLCLEWASSFLKTKYLKVRQLGGAGDKGRDIIGYYENGSIDIYQCKHYDKALSPSMIYKELVKLVYYTYKNHYPIPVNYYFVTSLNIGPKLQDWINNPTVINEELIKNWENNKNVTTIETIELEGDFKLYVEAFDFSILKDKSPLELIEEYSKTQYFAGRFGGGLKTYRKLIPTADSLIHSRELNYVTQLYEIYSEHHSLDIKNPAELKSASLTHLKHFEDQRNGFFAAESLEVFGRENFPDSDPLPFEEIKSDALQIAENALLLIESEKGLKKLLTVTQEVMRESYSSNPLSLEMKPIDKKGICHHLANDNKIKWVHK